MLLLYGCFAVFIAVVIEEVVTVVVVVVVVLVVPVSGAPLVVMQFLFLLLL